MKLFNVNAPVSMRFSLSFNTSHVHANMFGFGSRFMLRYVSCCQLSFSSKGFLFQKNSKITELASDLTENVNKLYR